MTKSNTSKKSNSYVFLDAMIIQATGDSKREKSEAMIDCLNGLAKSGYKLVISEFTGYERLWGLFGERAKKVATLLDTFENKAVTIDVYRVAAQLGGLYRDQKLEGIKVGDEIIAATAILEDGLVLTENHKDFPGPFFVREQYIPVQYETGKHSNKTIDLVLYKPDFELIKRRLADKKDAI